MMPSTRILVLPALAGLLSACTAFFPPDEKDDGVTRCDNVGDCDSPDNSRWDVECVHGEGQDESTSKVCAPVFRIVSCDPQDYKDHPLSEKYQQARDTKGVYVGCDMTKLGEQGCKPAPGNMCAQGLSVNNLGVCDEADATYPVAEASSDRAGLDVLDQFCRNYFCDAEWMCDSSTGTSVCRPCATVGEDGKPALGAGGCAEIWTQDADGAAERSTVYVDDVECGDDGLSPDAKTAARLAAEKVGPVPMGM